MYFKLFSVIAVAITLAACGGGNSGAPSGGATQAPANNSPVANNDTFELFANDRPSFDVLANDTDSDGDALSISSTTEPTAGQVAIVDNQIQYTPNTNFIGSDTFSYTISDGNNATDSAVVTISINNRPPTAVNDSITTLQSQSVSFEPLTNDSSAAQHTLVVAELTVPSNGQVALLDNVVTYVPAPGFVGQDAFAYTVRDALGDESTASVAVNVNNIIPIATADSANTQQNTSILINPLSNDVDAIGDVLSVSGNTLPGRGTVERQNDTFTYTPEDGYAGSDNFTYTIVDNFGATATATISIDVINTLPVTENDSTTTLENVAVEINVISNDSDVTGDAISVISVSTPLNGTVSLANNIVTYQPNLDYAGDDLFGYTIEDSHGASTSGFVNVLVSPGVRLRGKVIGEDLEGQVITISYGSKSVSATIDSSGGYEVIIDVEGQSSIVTASVAHPSSQYTYKAYFTDTKSLMEQANSDFIVLNLNLSDVTTAEFELLNTINGANLIADLASLNALRSQLVATYQLEAAVAAALIIESNNIVLPDSYSSVNDLMASPFEMRRLLSEWREQFSEEYYSAFDALFNNDNLTSAPNAIMDGNTIFQDSSIAGRMFDTNALFLNSNSQGHYLWAGTNKGEFSWQRSEQSLEVNFEEPFRAFVSDRKYCGSNDSSTVDFDVSSMQFRHLYSTADYDVFMRKNSGVFDDSECFDNTVHTLEYDAVTVYKTTTLDLAAGQYYLESMRAHGENEGSDDSDYHRISSLFTLNEDGTFEESISDFTPERSGVWSVSNNTLNLDYLNGFLVSYNAISSLNGIPVWSYMVLEGNALSAAGNSFVVAKDNTFVLDKTVGKFANTRNLLFDENIDGLFRLNFENNNLGGQSSFFFGAWTTLSTALFSWELQSNLYKAIYYFDSNSGQNVSFCDVSLENCNIWRQRSFEVIGKFGDNYMIKNYQEIGREPGAPPTTRSGYINFFSFENN